MLSVPLPFLAGLTFALVLHRSLRHVAVPGTRLYFNLFLVLYALQGVGIGLRFGYGIETLAPFLPVSAAAMPPLAFLAFQALTTQRVVSQWVHLAAPAAVALAVWANRNLVDPLLLVIFIAYGALLYQMTRTGGEVAVERAPFHRVTAVLRAARLTAGLMLFFGASDGLLWLYASRYGNSGVPVAVSLMNLAPILAVLVYYLAAGDDASAGGATTATAKVSDDDREIVAKVRSALDDRKLYKRGDLSLTKLARQAGVPARNVSAAVNRATGLNVSQFVNGYRVAEACRLLQETDMSSTQIMLESGFSTKSNFNREFRRITGQSPSEYRSRCRAKEAASR